MTEEEIKAQFTNEVLYKMAMQHVRDLFFADLINPKEYDLIQNSLIDTYQPKGVKKYKDWSEQEWIDYFNKR